MSFEGFVFKPYSIDNFEIGLLERADRPQIIRGWISNDGAYVGVYENVVRAELAYHRRPEAATRHVDFSYSEVNSGRAIISTQSSSMFFKVAPAVPLDPADRNAFVLYQVNVNGLTPVYAGTVLSLKAFFIEAFIPPDRYMRRGKPFLQQKEVRTLKGAE